MTDRQITIAAVSFCAGMLSMQSDEQVSLFFKMALVLLVLNGLAIYTLFTTENPVKLKLLEISGLKDSSRAVDTAKAANEQSAALPAS